MWHICGKDRNKTMQLVRIKPPHKHAGKTGTHDGAKYPNLVRVRIDEHLTTIALPQQVEAIQQRRAA